MKIEEILKNAGIEDDEAIKAVAAELPKSFMPLADANARIAKAKTAGDDVQKAFDAFKAEVEAERAKAAEDGDARAKALEELTAKYGELETRFNDSQNAIKQRDASSALKKALAAAGANAAAVDLLANAALDRVEFGEDGKPSNVDDVAEAVKADNAGLFGEQVDTGQKQQKADEKNDFKDAFLQGFGDTKRK